MQELSINRKGGDKNDKEKESGFQKKENRS